LPQKGKQPCAHILAGGVDGTSYIGVTASLSDRVAMHRRGLVDGFTSHHGVHSLVYYEMYETMPEAIDRKTRLTKWNRR